MTNDITEYVTRRLTAIQERRNFNPDDTARQVFGRAAVEYGEFRAIVAMVRVCKLPVTIPYDPAGGSVTVERTVSEARVYVLRESHRGVLSDVYKIGSSRKPYRRKVGVQSGNSRRLHLVADFPGGFALEMAIHKYLHAFSTRSVRDKKGGEWFWLPPPVIDHVRAVLASGDIPATMPTELESLARRH